MREEIIQKIEGSPINQVDLAEMAIKDNEIQEIIDLITLTKPSAQSVFLNHNLLSDIGALVMQTGFEKLVDLDYLDLQFNQIDKEGAFALMLLKAKNKKLRIALHGNKITDTAAMLDIESAANAASGLESK